MSVAAIPSNSSVLADISAAAALAGISRVDASATVAAAAAARVAAQSASSSVDISALGQLLASAATFPGSTDAAALSAATQRFVATYNAAQTGLNASAVNLQATLLGTSQGTTAVDFLQLQTALLLGNASGTSAALAGIGITFQSGSFGQASLDLTALQAALAADPAGTAALLTQAVQSAGQLASNLVSAGTGAVSGSAADLALVDNGTAALAVLASTAANNATGVQSTLLDAAQSGELAPALPATTPLLNPTPVTTVAAQTAVVTPPTTVTAAVITPAVTPTTPLATTTPVATTPDTPVSLAASTSAPAAPTTPIVTTDNVVANAVASTTAAAVASYYLSNGAFGSLIGERVANMPALEPRFGPLAPVQPLSRVNAIERL